jgi:pimeloyl-ACP methyl ester carboxylesterase
MHGLSRATRTSLVLLVALLALAGPPRPPARAASGALHITELGEGPALVFVPDLGFGRTSWMPTARKLLAGRRIVLVDLPGHGESPMPETFTLDACAAQLDQVLANEGDSTIVIGQGMGGLLAALAVKAHPDHARGLVLIDVGMRSPAKIPDQQREMFIKWMEDNYDTFLHQVYGKRGRDSTQSAEIFSQASLVPAATLQAYFREMITLDRSATLKEFPRPVLFVGSSMSWPADKSWSALATERGLDGLAAPDTVRIPQSAVLIAKDQPDSLASAIGAFTRKTLAAKK